MYQQYETRTHALVAMAMIAYGEFCRGEDNGDSTETAVVTVTLLQNAANNVAEEYTTNGDDGPEADAWRFLAGECESLLMTYENFAGDTSGEPTQAVHEAFRAALG